MLMSLGISFKADKVDGFVIVVGVAFFTAISFVFAEVVVSFVSVVVKSVAPGSVDVVVSLFAFDFVFLSLVLEVNFYFAFVTVLATCVIAFVADIANFLAAPALFGSGSGAAGAITVGILSAALAVSPVEWSSFSSPITAIVVM